MKGLLEDQVGFGKLKVTIVVAIIAATLCLLLVLLSGKGETIKIGAIISLSGPASHLVEVKESMILAIDEANSWGGINGKKIELIVEDCRSDPAEGKRAFGRIEAKHHPVLYVSTLSSVSMALAPLAAENRVVLVGLVVSSPAFAKQNGWVFRYYSSAEHEMQSALHILRSQKIKKLGILYQNDEYGTSVLRLLKEGFERAGGAVKSESFDAKATNFGAAISKLRDSEAIYLVGFPEPQKQIVRQLGEENYGGVILGSAGIIGIRTAPEANGVYTAAPIIYSPDYLFAREVRDKYEARYGKAFSHQAATGYDFVKLLAGLLEDRQISRGNIKTVLEEGFTYPGVFGNLDVEQGEHDILFPLRPARIVDGKVKYLQY